jgi:hypothetical protein
MRPLRRSSINPCFGRSLETRAAPWALRYWLRNCWSPIPTFVAPGSSSAILLCASGGLPNIEPDVQRGDFFCRRSGTQHQTFPSSLGPRKQLEAQFIIGEALRQLGQ